MATLVTTDALLKSAKRRAFMSTSGQALNDVDCLDIMNEAVQSYLVPLLLAEDENFFMRYLDVPLVSGLREYVLPTRAAAGRFDTVQVVDSAGSPRGDVLLPQELYDLAETDFKTAGTPIRYAIQANSLMLTPTPDSSVTGCSLRIYYPTRPSQLVLSASCARVTSAVFDTGVTTVTYTGTATGIAAGVAMDLIRYTSAFEVDALPLVGGVGTNAFTYVGTVPLQAKAGDWLALSETAPVVTWVPQEFAWCLAQKTACEMLRSRGDDAKLGAAQDGLAQEERRALVYLRPRDMAGRRVMPSGLNRFGRMRSWS